MDLLNTHILGTFVSACFDAKESGHAFAQYSVSVPRRVSVS